MQLTLDPKRKTLRGAHLSLALPIENLKSPLTCPFAQFISSSSFNIFTYLLLGTSPEEKTQWKLHHMTWPTQYVDALDAKEHYHEFLKALKTLGLSKASQTSVISFLVAILHILHLEFYDTVNGETGEKETRMKHPETFKHISNCLGVSSQDFAAYFITEASFIGKDVCSVMLSSKQAQDRAVNIAQLLYRTFFHWLIDFMNRRLAPKNEPFSTPLTLTLFHFPSPQWVTLDATSITLDPTSSSFTSVALSLEPFLEHYLTRSLENLHAMYCDEPSIVIPPLIHPESKRSSQLSSSIAHSPPTLKYFDALDQQMRDVYDFFANHSTVSLIHSLFSTTLPSPFCSLEEQLVVAPHSSEIRNKKINPTTDSSSLSTSSLTSSPNPFFILLESNHETSTFARIQSHVTGISYLQRHVVQVPITQLLTRFALLLPNIITHGLDPLGKLNALFTSLDITKSLCLVGEHDVWCTFEALMILNSALRQEKAERRRLMQTSEFSSSDMLDTFSVTSDTDTTYSDRDSVFEDGLGPAWFHPFTSSSSLTYMQPEAERNTHPLNPQKGVNEPSSSSKPASPRVSKQRRRWLRCVWFLTWWVPSPLLSMCGMKADEVRMAWREKVSICIFIFLASAAVLFFIVGAGLIICPRRKIYSLGELNALTPKNKLYTSIYGKLYSLNDLMATSTTVFHTNATLFPLAAQDATSGFLRTPYEVCGGLVKDPSVQLLDVSETSFRYIMATHQAPIKSNPKVIENYLNSASRIRGDLAIEQQVIVDGWKLEEPIMRFIFEGTVYDLTLYFSTLKTNNNFPSYKFLGNGGGGSQNGNGTNGSSSSALSLDQYIPLQASRGNVDLTDDALFQRAWRSSKAVQSCFNNLFRAGVLDDRHSLKCMVTDYILLAMSVVLCCIIAFKFIAALMLGGSTVSPANVDKFVILQVPCYTEDEKSLGNTLKSLATTHYGDKHKLLFIICDGMIVGRGNDKPTPRIVLDLLGHSADIVDPTPCLYQAIGVGPKQVNMAKVYSGLYSVSGHMVPYIVVAKCGCSNETLRPGNRGKRDSQMILMRFLNHVHTQRPLSPLEIELRHHFEHIIGVNPAWYEYMLMVDADTVVDSDALAKLVSYAMTDLQIVGCCGETRIVNEKETVTTMIQVYEYFISHHLSKAFESMFGTVTCLPGCFSMYRIKHASNEKPLLVSDAVIEEYGDVHINTLHKKNLLTLGEDRYLTTLILKSFPRMKTKFTSSSKCSTFVPESFSVLVSQRRRWINSTFHNLFELIWLNELCGFCCFSMRFVVLIELVSTIIMPATVLYLVYLIYLCVDAIVSDQSLSLVAVSLILIGAIYGLQAIVFLLKKEFSHIVWMIFYILAIPFFGFFLPLYSFWNMDDFSWGNTRVVVGEKGEKKVVLEESEVADVDVPSTIPHMTWDQYVLEMNETKEEVLSQKSKRSSISSLALSLSHSLSQTYPSRSSMISQVMDPPSPSDEDLAHEIEMILSSADLMLVTKRSVREQLTSLFGVDLTHRKQFINQTIDYYLAANEKDVEQD
ncbi:hypothetical protein HMI56_007399 [Coelomomyces lativittatus]|nr:hypothetical protein HMI56_007399 [Coelomomyces lativittatus]